MNKSLKGINEILKEINVFLKAGESKGILKDPFRDPWIPNGFRYLLIHEMHASGRRPLGGAPRARAIYFLHHSIPLGKLGCCSHWVRCVWRGG